MNDPSSISRKEAGCGDVTHYSCPVCKKEFSSIYKMLKHLDNVHVNARSFHVCSRCGVKCKSKIGLKAHKKTHELICSHCGKVYAAVSTLNAHMIRVHSGLTFSCDFPNCEYIGKTKQALDFHQNAHSGLKPYTCKHCRKSYQRKDTLSRHQLLCKTGVTCETCGTKFGSKNCLKDHVRAVHSNERFVCLCGSVFKYRASFNRHQKQAGHYMEKDVAYSNELEITDIVPV